jgi:riboflavin kinase/FMN adenylyltransferase
MPGPALLIGNFDGVHIGHRELVRRAREAVGGNTRAGPPVLALSFDPHPSSVLRPDAAPQRLTSFEHRAELLIAAGATSVERLLPEPALLEQSPEEFISSLVQRYRPAVMVEGEDFRFGRKRSGDVDFLRTLGTKLGFHTIIVPPVAIDLNDQSIVVASSTRVRWLLNHGRVNDAARLLGRPYQIRGTVTQGDRRGRTIGIPTANVATDQLLPLDGVYGGIADAGPAGRYAAAISIGTRPTFKGHTRRMEVHLLDAPRDEDRIRTLPEYGWPIHVDITHWVRDDMRFAGIDAITSQIRRDISRVRTLHATIGHS